MNIILIGFMGTGKTAVGKRLAKRLGWSFVDIDDLVETGARMPIAKIFSERGEAVFRRLERRYIARVVHGRHQVIATGGGAFVDPKNRGLLRASGTVICLTARPQVILARAGRRLETRPLLAGAASPLAKIRTLLARRSPAYAHADLTIDTSDLSVEEVVERIWEQVSSCLCASWDYFLSHAGELSHRYGGKYVVVAENRIVASGNTQLEAYHKACLRPADRRGRQAPARVADKPDVGIFYIPLPEESLTAL